MKGDEGVQTVEERCNLFLFFHFFRHQKDKLAKRRKFYSTLFDKRTCSCVIKSFQGNWCFKVRAPETATFVIVNRKYIVIPGNTDTKRVFVISKCSESKIHWISNEFIGTDNFK